MAALEELDLWQGRAYFGNDDPAPGWKKRLVRRKKKSSAPESTRTSSRADIQKIAQAGFNVVRVPRNDRVFEGDGGWRILDRLLGWCEKHKVYVVLDLHAVPGGQSRLGMADPADTGHLVWASEENQAKTLEIWKAIAARYHNRQIIAGYDLINEPAPPAGKDLVRLYQRIIRAIRVDPNHLIIVEGGKFASDFSMFDKPLCENQAFSLHMYTWFGDDRKKEVGGLSGSPGSRPRRCGWASSARTRTR